MALGGDDGDRVCLPQRRMRRLPGPFPSPEERDSQRRHGRDDGEPYDQPPPGHPSQESLGIGERTAERLPHAGHPAQERVAVGERPAGHCPRGVHAGQQVSSHPHRKGRPRPAH